MFIQYWSTLFHLAQCGLAFAGNNEVNHKTYQDSSSPGQDLKWGPSVYEVAVPTPTLWHCRICSLLVYVFLCYCPGVKLSRRVLSCCWDSMLTVLSAGLGDLRGQLGVTSSLALLLGSEVAREEHRRARDSIVASLDGLQKAACLSNILGTDTD
jgi:hypothetical protein